MPSLEYAFKEYELHFRFEAGTSKGKLKTKKSLYVKVWEKGNPEIFGIGEFGPLSWLSPDFHLSLEKIQKALPMVWEGEKSIASLLQRIPSEYPGLRFTLETALRDLAGGGGRLLYPSRFTAAEQGLLINGLVWMNEPEHMWQQAEQLIAKGFEHIKCKVGALDFDEELRFLRKLRNTYPKIEIRLDANGAFTPEQAMGKLETLAHIGIHSIEQPIATGQWEAMAKLCASTPIPIALDEELIGLDLSQAVDVLAQLKPQYCIFKPMLLGGLDRTATWIKHCEQLGIGWWLTSMLESNIGLNAICQFAAIQDNPLPQGLGTGSLYQNNFRSPLHLQGPFMHYDQAVAWELPYFNA